METLDFYPLVEDVDTFGRVNILAPSGCYKIELHQSFMSLVHVQGLVFSFQIEYSNVAGVHVLPKEMGFQTRQYHPKVFVVLTLNYPITRNQEPFSHIVIQFQMGLSLSALSLHEDHYNGDTKPYIKDTECELFIRSLTLRSCASITFNGSFRSCGKDYAVRADVGVELGFLYPLEDSLLYIPYPSRQIMYREIGSVEFVRLPGCSRGEYFHLLIRKMTRETFLFEFIHSDEHGGLYNFLKSRGLIVSIIDLERVDNVNAYIYGYSGSGEDHEDEHEFLDADTDEDDQD